MKERMKYKMYIAGPVTGVPNYKEAFIKAKDMWDMECIYDDIITPLDICEDHWGWKRCMIHCLWKLIWCDTVYFLNGFENSRGASIEHKVSKFLNKEIIYEYDRRR